MPAQDVTLYAVYAVDANGNGKPDYNDDAVHVRYHGNNGVYTDILCPHHHVVGATAKLSTSGTVSGKSLGHDKPASAASSEVKNHTFTYGDNIFIGWSTSPILDTIIKTRADYDRLASSIVTEVTMEKAKTDGGNADDDGNTNVYAVWAADRNGNKTADYLEEYTLTYESNAQQGGTVTKLPTDTNIHLPGDEVILSKAVPTHDDVGGKKVVFIGWTEAKTNSIFSRADDAPATVTKVTFGSDNKTVYAAWGYDENDNGTADVLETYTLTYDLNGGNEAAPAKVSGIKKNTEVELTEVKGFTRNPNEIFVGWSATKHDAALTAQDKQEDVEKFLITGAKYRITTADVTLYAVWAIDSNGDGTPDYQTTYTVSYDLDGGIAVDGETYDEENVKPGETITIKAAPIRKGYAFAGWHDGTKTYKPGDNVTILDADLKLTAQWKKDPGTTGSTDPDKPTDPSKPNGSSDPTDPDKPTDPATTGKPDKPNDNPLQTGDETNLALWLALFGISLTGIIAGLLGSKRKHSEKHNNK